MPSFSRRLIKAARYIAYCAAVLVVLVVAAALFLPDVLDTPAVRAEIQRVLSRVVRGNVAWEELRIRILPYPHGALRKARLEIPPIASVSAEEARARLRLLPLLRGHVEIASVTVTRPVIRITAGPAAAVERKAPEREPATDNVGLYRSVMEPVVDAVREFAPDTFIEIEDAELEVRIPDAPPMQLRKLTFLAHAGAGAMEFEATAESQYWSWLTLSAQVEYADLSAKANLQGANVKPQAWIERYLGKAPVGVSLAEVRLRVEARTDAKTALEFEIDARTDSVGIARAGERLDIRDVGVKGSVRLIGQEAVIGVREIRFGDSRLASGELHLSMKDGIISGHSDYNFDLAQGMDYTRRLVPAPVHEALESFQPVTGRAQGRVRLKVGPRGWNVGMDVRKSDVAVQIRDLPGPVHLAGGTVDFDSHRVTLDRVALAMPAGKVLVPKFQYVFKAGSAAGGASFELDVAQSLELARRALPEENRSALADIETAAGRVEGSAKFAFGRGDWKLGVDVSKSDATLGVRQLPGPLRIAGLSVEATP
ncbi:MAG TPA: AsmA family protein, partial [Burkholderiales bacterium]|nr:AsmA family protein [Burkholderiales bacterium]